MTKVIDTIQPPDEGGFTAPCGSERPAHICPECGERGRQRAGAEFAGEMRCKHGHVWPWAAANGYSHLP